MEWFIAGLILGSCMTISIIACIVLYASIKTGHKYDN